MLNDNLGGVFVSDVISNVISAAGVIVTGYFSYRVLKATKATNEVAAATLALNKRLEAEERKRNESARNIVRMQILPEVLKESQLIYTILSNTDPRVIYKRLLEQEYTLGIEMEDLAKYFNVDEVEKITTAWRAYEDYRAQYFQTVYGGNEMNVLTSQAPPVLYKFEELFEWFQIKYK